MRITRLELRGYKRLMLSGIHYLNYIPASALQIIIGTNGCGKSSLLFELSPLPASPSDFLKGGSKTIEIEHNGMQYVLSSQFATSNHHSFIKDGNELNPGKTAQVQKDLVYLEFGWTKELQDLMLGVDKFTLMSPSKRREWVVQLSNVSYDYIIQLYQRLSSKQRDMQGALKHLDHRLNSETQKLNAIEEGEGFDKIALKLRSELTTLLRYSQRLNHKGLSLDQMINDIKRCASAILGFTLPDNIPSSQSELKQKLQDAQDKVVKTQQAIHLKTKQYQELEDEGKYYKDQLLDWNIEDTLIQTQSKIKSYTPGLFKIPHPDKAYEISVDLVTHWHDIFSQLPDNKDGQFNKANYNRLLNDRQTLKSKRDDIQLKYSILNNKLIAFDQSDDTKCPECGHTWKIGYEQSDVDGWRNSKNDLSIEIESLDTKIQDLSKSISQIESVQALYRQLSILAQSNPLLKPLWDYVLDNQLHVYNPSHSLGLFNTWIKECDRASQYESALSTLEKLTEIKEAQDSGLYQNYLNKRALVESEIDALTKELHLDKENLSQLKYKDSQMERYYQMSKQLEHLMEMFHDRLKHEYQVLANRLIEDQVGHHQSKLAHIETTLSQLTTLKGIVEDLKRSRDDVASSAEVLGYLTKELSPVSGLIAEEISRFLSHVIDQLNTVLQSIWTYDLRVLPCQVEDTGDLTYKFAIDHGLGQPVPDISKGSQAQQDIINFSFVLLVMVFKGLDYLPLYLDELGSSFDEQHRINLMNFIKHLVDSGRHEQIFLISHYAAQYSSMSGAEVLVLDQKNVAVPQHYNQHVTFQSPLNE